MRCASLLLVLASLLPLTSLAQSAAVPPILAGSYVYREGPDHGRATVMAALEPHIAMLPYFTQSLVRDRVAERIALPRQIVVALPPDPAGDVSVEYTGTRVVMVVSPIGGSTTITTATGTVVPVTQRVRLGWLEQVFSGETGTLSVMLSCEPDGRTMHVDGTMRSENLPTPITIRLDYTRSP
jgi:hypothetical protein